MAGAGNTRTIGASIDAAVKVLAAVLGLAGYVQIVGGGVLWARFHEAGLPALRLVAEMPRDYVFVLGAAALVVPIAVGLAAAALQYAFSRENPEGVRPHGFTAVLTLLVIVAWIFVIEILTIDDIGWRIGLAVAAPLFAIVTGVIARDTTGFRYLTLLFFLFGALYGGLVAFAVELSRDPRLDLAIAVVKDADTSERTNRKTAVAGLLVGKSSDSILIARSAPVDPGRWQIVDLRPADVERFEFGPRGQRVTQASMQKARSYAYLALRGQHDIQRCRGLFGSDLPRSLSAIERTEAIQVRVCVARRGAIRVNVLASRRVARLLGVSRGAVIAMGHVRSAQPGVPRIVKARLTPQAVRRISRLRRGTVTVEVTLTDRLDRVVRTRKRLRFGA